MNFRQEDTILRDLIALEGSRAATTMINAAIHDLREAKHRWERAYTFGSCEADRQARRAIAKMRIALSAWEIQVGSAVGDELTELEQMEAARLMGDEI